MIKYCCNCKWSRFGVDEPLCVNPKILEKRAASISTTELVYGECRYANCLFERRKFLGLCKPNGIFFESKE